MSILLSFKVRPPYVDISVCHRYKLHYTLKYMRYV